MSILYKVSSIFNVCLSFAKEVKLNSEKLSLCTFVIAEQSDLSRKISLAITRQITQEDKFVLKLLLTTTTAARSFQEAVITSHCS